ncbi:MAG TPA: hypothetical protein DCG19_15355 [Cryomorphaceae bacterium]|nr:hypothetical protein [Owenweeksia sp.]MBF99961.1 hypothetical protein [Owenweeksia sp.]HAD98789.1 hypothetical protein [Cryomorphaceae bacterium]HBF19961.1 hypothetical protein [Cryomorphaceae bacterium]HCQ16656.1 hypothetical protein [Cryomorphaceae bacterium]|tara:strand:- start:2880 stop:3152 length:273 start_codon:yes stop_codon:yes gene_type:complete
MGYEALITLDLPNSTDEQRDKFYEVLAKEKWVKLKTLTTTWTVLFNDGVTRARCVEILMQDLKKAKEQSRIYTVAYAIQLDQQSVEVDKL